MRIDARTPSAGLRALVLGLVLLLGVPGAWLALSAPALLSRAAGSAAAADDAIVIAAAGDIACPPGKSPSSTSCRQGDTSDVVLGLNPAAVLPLGDEQYDKATTAEFVSYNASWGRFKAISRPVPGNHEYDTSGATGYYGYFGAAAGDPRRGYYSWDIGSWHLIALNSNCSAAGGCNSGSPQETWLRADLAAHPGQCTLAYWHHPRFSSGSASSSTGPFWNDLYAAHADVVLSGHSHVYEHFAPQSPSGAADPQGLREFVVGTGGVGFGSLGSVKPNTVARQNNTFGVLQLKLRGTSYEWSFRPVAGSTWTDSGSSTCHSAGTAAGPAAPTGLAVSGTPTASSVGLSWTASTGPNVAGYRVYRDGSATPLDGSLVTGTTYTDGTVTGGVTYSYQVTAVDTAGLESARSGSVSVTTPNDPGGGGVLDVPIRAGSDDAEEATASGAVDLGSSDLELVTDGTAVQTVGMRFTGVTVPVGATITSAYVQFQVDEVSTAATSLSVTGQAADNAPTFTTAALNVSGRPRTAAAVGWVPATWPTVGDRGVDQRTPNLASVVQEIVSRQGWASGNALALLVTGSGRRTAEAFESGQTIAPVLHIQYTSDPSAPPPNAAPVVNAGPDVSVTRPAAATVGVSVTDDGLPNPPGAVTTAWSTVSGPGTVTFVDPAAVSTSATFSAAGSYVLRLTGNDGALQAADDVTVTVSDPAPPGAVVLDVPIQAGSDDAEERTASGAVDLGSSDLELVTDGTAVQVVGMRFAGVTVRVGATITSAYVQFQVDEVSTAATSLTVEGQAADSPPTFTTAALNVSGRPRTAAAVGWVPATWPTVGDRGVDQRTPNLASVVQEIVSRSGWASGNALALLVTGSGRRTAEAFESGQTIAPVLHIEYTV